jgi:hypothetical protein
MDSLSMGNKLVKKIACLAPMIFISDSGKSSADLIRIDIE